MTLLGIDISTFQDPTPPLVGLERTTHEDNIIRGFQSRYGPEWVRPSERPPQPRKLLSAETRERMRAAQQARRARERQDAA